jgi:hypothetical protein
MKWGKRASAKGEKNLSTGDRKKFPEIDRRDEKIGPGELGRPDMRRRFEGRTYRGFGSAGEEAASPLEGSPTREIRVVLETHACRWGIDSCPRCAPPGGTVIGSLGQRSISGSVADVRWDNCAWWYPQHQPGYAKRGK